MGCCPESQAQPELPGGPDTPGQALERWGGVEREIAALSGRGRPGKAGRDSTLGQTPSRLPRSPRREAQTEFNIPSILVRGGSRMWRVKPTSRRCPGCRARQGGWEWPQSLRPHLAEGLQSASVSKRTCWRGYREGVETAAHFLWWGRGKCKCSGRVHSIGNHASLGVQFHLRLTD